MSGTGPGAGSASAPLVFDAEVRRGDFRLHAAFEVEAGETVGVVGPNGAGKSTLLGAIAGVLHLSAGRIAIGDRALAAAPGAAADAGPGRDAAPVGGSDLDPGSRARTHRSVSLPRSQRGIGHLDQKPRLFPHLDAAENIAFGLRAAGMRRREARGVAAEWLERVGLAGRDRDRPAAFSGGQQ
ncbi:MAG: ATP-binding cassette domain-containing protein, partial [Leucobacter sp.]